MKIIISYASAGAGHFKAAEAIYNYLKENYPDIELKVIDLLKTTNALFRFSYTWGYSFLVTYAPLLWQWGFWITRIKILRPLTGRFALLYERINLTNFMRFLVSKQADFIISTHFLPAKLAAYLKRKGRIKSQLVTVITDFGVHPFWIAEGTDTYIAACDAAKQQLISENIDEGKIKVSGIPVDSKFLVHYDQDLLFKKFHLDKHKFTVLISTGSFGIGPIEKIVDLLHDDVQILVVCAKNKRLYTRLKQKKYPNLRVFGFIDNIQELMSISRIIITKPGGLSIAESLSMEVVPVFIIPIPGQEKANIKILAESGIGIYARQINMIKDAVLDFKQHPDKLRIAKEKINQAAKPFAAREICNVICQGSSGFAG